MKIMYFLNNKTTSPCTSFVKGNMKNNADGRYDNLRREEFQASVN